MRIVELEVRSFRCFEGFRLPLGTTMSLIEGNNGAGKSSLIEALYYACYGRSFRTRFFSDMVHRTDDSFSLKLTVEHEEDGIHTIHLGCSKKKRIIKIDGRTVTSYRSLLDVYRVIGIMESDMEIIRGSPESRRLFLDQSLIMQRQENEGNALGCYSSSVKMYRRILQQRNSLILLGRKHHEEWTIWTEKLISLSSEIRKCRLKYLMAVNTEMNRIIATSFEAFGIVNLQYKFRDTFESADEVFHDCAYREFKTGHTLFGSHLDDFIILHNGRDAHKFSSRGQQKFIVALIKIIQFVLLDENVIFLLDDFAADLDETRILSLMTLVRHYAAHIICTTPLRTGILHEYVKSNGGELIKI